MLTIHAGTAFSGGTTIVGDDCYFMVGTHIAHDCHVGRNVIAANNMHLAGHVDCGGFLYVRRNVCNHATLPGRQYCYVGGGSLIRKDLPPFMVGKGNEFVVQGINTTGLQRNGFSQKTVARLRKVYKIFYLQHLTVSRAIEKIVVELGETDEIVTVSRFCQSL